MCRRIYKVAQVECSQIIPLKLNGRSAPFVFTQDINTQRHLEGERGQKRAASLYPEALISVCSSLFSGLTIQSLQSFDIGWDEWVNLPSDFTLQSRVKLKAVYISAKNRTTYGNKPKTKSLQATLQTSLYGDLSVDKNNVIPGKPMEEKYLFPNAHTERLKYYNKATEEIFEDHDDFPTPSKFKNYLLVERQLRYEMIKQTGKVQRFCSSYSY